jgi:hypothetical protein
MPRTAAVFAAAGLALAAASAARAETACADLAKVALPHAEITGASTEAIPGGQACKLTVTSRPTARSDIRIEVWIPMGLAWNGSYVQVGNGGFAGQVPSGQIKGMASRGYAAAGTDDGHQRPVGVDASWALGEREKFTDFAWRALKETTDAAKALIAAQKGSGPAKAYFAGCSDGGREALMEAQRFPNDFDGIVAGAPAYDMSRLFAHGASLDQHLSRPGGYLGPEQRSLLQSAALKLCGNAAGYIPDPLGCRFDPAALACKPGESGSACLSPAQLASAKAIYEGPKDPRTGKRIVPGFSPGGEALPGSWSLWLTGASEDKLSSSLIWLFSSNAFKYFAFEDPAYDMLKLDFGAEFDRARARTKALDSIDPDLKAFKAHGGKLIHYHGWNDPAIPPRASIVYYEDMSRTMGGADDFYRMYLVPGMLHCGGGPGPNNVDWLAQLDGWVKGGPAPAELTATGAGGASQTLCPYPAVAKGGACAKR